MGSKEDVIEDCEPSSLLNEFVTGLSLRPELFSEFIQFILSIDELLPKLFRVMFKSVTTGSASKYYSVLRPNLFLSEFIVAIRTNDLSKLIDTHNNFLISISNSHPEIIFRIGGGEFMIQKSGKILKSIKKTDIKNKDNEDGK